MTSTTDRNEYLILLLKVPMSACNRQRSKTLRLGALTSNMTLIISRFPLVGRLLDDFHHFSKYSEEIEKHVIHIAYLSEYLEQLTKSSSNRPTSVRRDILVLKSILLLRKQAHENKQDRSKAFPLATFVDQNDCTMDEHSMVQSCCPDWDEMIKNLMQKTRISLISIDPDDPCDYVFNILDAAHRNGLFDKNGNSEYVFIFLDSMTLDTSVLEQRVPVRTKKRFQTVFEKVNLCSKRNRCLNEA